MAEPQRAESELQDRAKLIAEPTFLADVVVLRQRRALDSTYSISLAVGFAVSLMIASRNPAMRPKAREIAIIAVATLVMALAIRPLNGLGSPAVAALLALIGGGGVFGSALLAFDVAGLRARAVAEWRAPRDRWSPLARRHY